jgi:hypothetical protein
VYRIVVYPEAADQIAVKASEDKTFPGAIVASLASPWVRPSALATW